MYVNMSFDIGYKSVFYLVFQIKIWKCYLVTYLSLQTKFHQDGFVIIGRTGRMLEMHIQLRQMGTLPRSSDMKLFVCQ